MAIGLDGSMLIYLKTEDINRQVFRLIYNKTNFVLIVFILFSHKGKISLICC